MKLFTRYNRINLLATVVIFLLSSGAFYVLLRFVLIDQVDGSLKIEQREILEYVNRYNRLPEPVQVKNQATQFRPTPQQVSDKQRYRTLQLFDPFEKEQRPFRQLNFSVQAGGQWYEATVSKSLEGTDKLTRAIILITLGTLLLILVAGMVINRMVLKKLWQPFYQTLSVMQGFQLGQKKQLQFPQTGITEFRLMAEVLEQTTGKAEQDYRLLKEFTENASHELQTPLAVIQSKLDLLIQDEQLSQQQSQAALAAYDAIQKLARLNQSLLLLAKIENRQFEQTTPVHLKEKITEKLQQLEELVQSNALTLTVQLEEAVIQMNADLADILLNNLLSNSIRHNKKGGHILLQLQARALTISNTGAAAALDPLRLFTRFYKGSSSGSHGLGLSIAQQICQVSGCRLSYDYTNGLHRFRLQW
jgi:signal transduction histidine kinase